MAVEKVVFAAGEEHPDWRLVVERRKGELVVIENRMLGGKASGNAGNAQSLIDWYNQGAGGAVDWGSPGDFDACVSIASSHVADPEAFCAQRHHDATGAWPGHAPGEGGKAAYKISGSCSTGCGCCPGCTDTCAADCCADCRLPQHPTGCGCCSECAPDCDGCCASCQMPAARAAMAIPFEMTAPRAIIVAKETAAGHVHGGDDLRPVIALDLHGTLTPAEGFPMDGFGTWPSVKEWLDRWRAMGACLHLTTAALAHHAPEIVQARLRLIQDWLAANDLVVDAILPKAPAHVYYGRRVVPVPAVVESWDTVGQLVEQHLAEHFDLADGTWVRRPADMPDAGAEPVEGPLELPVARGYDTPVLDVDIRTLWPAADGQAVPAALDALTAVYQGTYTVHLSSADPRLWAWVLQQTIPCDGFVGKDHADVRVDNRGMTATDWTTHLPRLLARLGPSRAKLNEPLTASQHS